MKPVAPISAKLRRKSPVAASVDDLGGGLSRDVAEALQTLPPRRVRRLYAATLPPGAVDIPCEDAVNVIGLPQRSIDSGVCWFGSLLWLLRMPPRVRAIVDAAIARSNRPVAAELRRRLPRVLTHSQEGYDLHTALFKLHKIGDAIGIPPEEEGQNGYTQLMMLCTVLDLPALTMIAGVGGRLRDVSDMPLHSKYTTMAAPRRPGRSEKALLGVRVMRDAWKPPLRTSSFATASRKFSRK